MSTTISLRQLRRIVRLFAVVTAIGVPLGLFYGGAQPVAVGLIPAPWDKLAHAAVFALLAGAIGYASGLHGLRMVLLAFLGALAIGAADEWRQMYLAGRSAGWDDLAADGAGGALGAFALQLRARVRNWLERRLVNRH